MSMYNNMTTIAYELLTETSQDKQAAEHAVLTVDGEYNLSAWAQMKATAKLYEQGHNLKGKTAEFFGYAIQEIRWYDVAGKLRADFLPKEPEQTEQTEREKVS